MTRKIFWQDPYLTSLDTQIASVNGQHVTLEETIFYAEAEKRYWLITGFAKVPCGGTHLKRTGEVGEITLKRNNIGKGKERVEIYLNEKADMQSGF